MACISFAYDPKWMRIAIELAARGAGRTHPNPSVGAVVVKSGKIVGRGWHEGPGTPHAEVIALREAGRLAKGADLYVTLEPCPTFGKTPPCTDAIISAGVRKVVTGTRDPNPDVKGKGISILRKHGIEVLEDALRKEAVGVDPAYHVFYRKKRPYVHLKWAQSVDGETAGREGGYITGAEARRNVHEERFLSDAILVTSGTVMRDEPRLTIRLPRRKKPLLRIIVDRHGLSSLPARLAETAPGSGEIWIFRHKGSGGARIKAPGVAIFELNAPEDPDLFLQEILRFLREKRVMSLYVESVGRLAAELLNAGFVDRLSVNIAPVILGAGPSPRAAGVALKRPISLEKASETSVGKDRWFRLELEGACLRD